MPVTSQAASLPESGKPMRIALVLVLGSVVLTGCSVSSSFVRANEPPHTLAPRPDDAVEIFVSGPPQRPFIDLGMIRASSYCDSMYNPGRQAVLDEIRHRAALQGCDGVILSRGGPGACAGSGICIVYRTVAPP